MAYEKTTADHDALGVKFAKSSIADLEKQGLCTYTTLDALLDAASSDVLKSRDPAYWSAYQRTIRDKLDAMENRAP